MKIYRISQSENNDYDTYDSAVVCAESKKDAREIHPSKFCTHFRDGVWYGTYSNKENIGEEYEFGNHDWVSGSDTKLVKVELIGEADEETEKGVILSSFNAG